MDTTMKLLVGGAVVGGAYFLLKNKAGDTVGLGTLAFKNVGDLCYADVTFKNTGGINFIPKVAFAISPPGYEEDFAALPKDGVTFGPNETQTVTTNSIAIPPYTTDGPVWARIQIGTPEGLVIPGAVIEVDEAYTMKGYGAEIISYTFN